MQQRMLGATGQPVSVLGFGCGAVGGLMVRGTASDQERAVGRALDLGITYFDTAAAYGAGESERALGRAIRSLGADPVVGTKVGVPADAPDIGAAVVDALEASLTRLGRDSVDLFQLHNPITAAGGRPALTPVHVLGEVVPAMQRLRAAGKIRFWGITAIGDTDALQEVVDAGAVHTAQVPFNLLNPSGAMSLPPGFAAQDMRGLMTRAQAKGVGVIGIRILAAGALSGEAWRHPIAVPDVAPIASGADYHADLARARRLLPLVQEGYAGSLVEAAVRFAITPGAMSCALIGLASLEQLEAAAAAALIGPLSAEAMVRVGELWGAMPDG
jgi:L-galactose dehydrogenase/L-glyceraldehyde 3-phosphate reductase